VRLDTVLLRGGKFLARPAGAVGNCGFHPFPWVGVYGDSPDHAKANFRSIHQRYIEIYQSKKGELV